MTSNATPTSTPTPTPSRAGCEITTTFNGTIVDARSVGGPATRAADATPWLFAGALVSLIGAGLFTAELARAADEAAARAHASQGPMPRDATPSAEVMEDPSSSRGAGLIDGAAEDDPKGSFDLGALAAALALLGLIPLGVGASLRRGPARDRFTVGEGAGVDVPISLSDADRRRFDADGRFTLVRSVGHELVLGLCPSLRGTITHAAGSTDVAALAGAGRRSWALPEGARAELELGAVRFTLERAPAQPLELSRRPFDTGFLFSNVASALLIGGLLTAAQFHSPAPASMEEIEELAMTQRIMAFLEQPPPPADEEKAERELRDPEASYYPTQGSAPRERPARRSQDAAAGAPEAAAPEAEEDATVDFKAVALRNAVPKARRGVTAADLAREQAESLFAFADGFAETQDASMHLYRDDSDLPVWEEMQSAPLGGLMPGGLDLAPTRRGGGGRAEGVRNPDGSDASDKSAFARQIIASTGFGANQAWKRQAADPRAKFDDDSLHTPRARKRIKTDNALSPKRALAELPSGSVMSKGEISVDGSRSAGAVERVVGHYIPSFRRCYERELARRPGLKGELEMSFTINADGLVEGFKIKKNSLKSGKVSGCIARTVNKWMFSIQEGAGATRVVFPLRFSPGG